MKPKSFDYLKVASAEEAVIALAQGGEDARIIAGGLSLMPMLNFRLAEPKILIDISKVESLSYIRETSQHVEMGAATRQGDLMKWERLGQCLPLVAAACPYIGHYQTRAKGTVCGSLVHACLLYTSPRPRDRG